MVEERSAYSIADPTLAVILGYTPVDGSSVSPATALTLSAVYRAVSIVAGSVASLPLRTVEENADGQKAPVSSFLDKPGGDWFTPFEWTELCMITMLMRGEVFLQHMRNGAGTLSWLNPVAPENVAVYWDANRPGGKRFEVTIPRIDGRESEVITLDPSSMTQIMGLTLDGLRGISPIGAARLSLSTGLAGEKSANRQFTNGALISGMVTPEGDEDLEEGEALEVKQTINRKMIGPENAGDIPVINRRLKFTPWTMSAADAQFIESRTFSVDEVGRWFGVPPHLLGLTEKSTSWGQGIAEQNRGLARYTLQPWTSRMEQRLSRLIASPKRAVEFDYAGFVKPSPEDEVNLLIAQVNAGLLTLNEARKVRNLPALPPETGADLPRLPAGAVPPAQAGAPAETEPAPLGGTDA